MKNKNRRCKHNKQSVRISVTESTAKKQKKKRKQKRNTFTCDVDYNKTITKVDEK